MKAQASNQKDATAGWCVLASGSFSSLFQDSEEQQLGSSDPLGAL
jgi:hypothetical protein